MKCPTCGEVVVPGATTCLVCGSPLAVPEVAAAPPPGVTQPPPAPGPPSPPVAQPPRPAAKQATSGWAIAALILGICGFTCIPFIGSVLAIVFGFLARSEIKKSGGRLKGSGLATAGIVLGIILIALMVIAAAVAVPLYYVYIGPERIITRTVDLEGATAVNAEIDMTGGYLNVTGTEVATTLMSGGFTTNVKKWRPEINYDVTGSTGNLTVRQGEGLLWPWWPVKNEWNIRFNDDVPLYLKTKLSVGKSMLSLGSLNLTGLKIDSSAGNVYADLSGTKNLLGRVTAQLSVGSIDLIMKGEYGTPVGLNVSSSAGSVDISLLGQWKAGLDGNVKASAGSVNLRLPQDVGVYVSADTSTGQVNPGGLRRTSDGSYVNDAYGTSPVTLRLDVSTSAGDINLTLGY